MRYLVPLIFLGTSGCLSAVSDDAICAGLRAPVDRLEAGLRSHPETPQAVGEPATDVVLGFNGPCAK